MDSRDMQRLRRSTRRAYELGRLRRAALGVLPLLIVIAVAVVAAYRPLSTLAIGGAAVLLSGAMLWYGRDPQRAWLPGVAAGLIPLVLATCANNFHACGADGCSSYCVPACVVGGVVSGLVVAAVGVQRRAGVGFWLPASALALLTGAMGCACVGYSGIAGLGVGFALGAVPGFVRRALMAAV